MNCYNRRLLRGFQILVLIHATGSVNTDSSENIYCPKDNSNEATQFTIGSSCYQIVDNIEPVTYESANAYCKSRHGHLLTIKDNDTQIALEAEIDKGSDSHTVLLGLQKEGAQWMWVTGDVAVYTNWNPNSSDGDCAKMKLRKSGLWDRVDCAATDWFTIYICEYSEAVREKINHHSQTGLIVGICVGIFVLLILVIVVVLIVWFKRQQTRKQNDTEYTAVKMDINPEPASS